MTWLTRVRLPLREAAVRRLCDSYAWHQALWESFPTRDGQTRDFLMRFGRKRDGFEAFIVSEDKPTPPAWGTWETKEIADSFLAHDRYRFSLRANPTVKRTALDEKGEIKKNSRRVAIYNEGALREWLRRKAEQGGFAVEDVSFTPPVRQSFRKKGQRGTHAAVDFEGVLRVTDRQAFRESFAKGIGSAKAFGFGMLMLMPVRDDA
ncbi:MAG: type I-E CRISPR-associated protein Cas6/Cse3/CasE [Candidatus Eisenbacteria sp.]|nr:type I-E CRISPR-associated protein Cas6/Cse3/CasE [Candidatus Eisenbacteria bacterium]